MTTPPVAPGAREADPPDLDRRRPAPILVVDDDEWKRFALERLLSPLGHQIVAVESATGALRCLLDQDFAVILLDVRMPGMDGLETAALIRMRRRSELTPIIMITASTRDEIAMSGIDRATLARLIFVSIDTDDLLPMVSSFAGLFQERQELQARLQDAEAAADWWQRRAVEARAART